MSPQSRLWFTLWNGILTEIYYPTIDRPQMRDLEFLLTDPEGGFHEEKRHLRSHVEPLDPDALAYRVVNTDPDGRFALEKTVWSDPRHPTLLMRTRFLPRGDARGWRLYLLCAPHLEVGGWGNNGHVLQWGPQTVLAAEKGGTWLAVGSSAPWTRASVGYVGRSDGWTDVNRHGEMRWEFDRAPEGNIALTGELPAEASTDLLVGVSLGSDLSRVLSQLRDSLETPVPQTLEGFCQTWRQEGVRRLTPPLFAGVSDGGRLYRQSYALLRAHEDKTHPGAFIASLSIPWGAAKGDEDRGGYHLVWTRDLANVALGLLAVGDAAAARRALAYLIRCQRPDGGFPQNFWINGEPYWAGRQLDEVGYPILLAAKLERGGELGSLDPWPMVRRAARYLVEHGPATEQDRWEEVGGYSPSTLAVHIAALVAAATMARGRGDLATADFLERYADFLECHLETWTVTHHGTLVPDHPRHYIRILPTSPDDPTSPEDPETARIHLRNIPPGEASVYPAREVVDAGFLHLVRWGIRAPDDPLIRESVTVVDRILRVETPAGPVWKRFNHDGYGQGSDGAPYTGHGVGRPWPLLTGERGHYELASGHDARPYAWTMERLATPLGLLPEQVWDGPERPDLHLTLGSPTEAAMPLAWAHGEYLSLLRSIHDGRVFNLLPEVSARYVGPRRLARPLEVWKGNRQPRSLLRGRPLRVIASDPFLLHWTADHWHTSHDETSTDLDLGLSFVDIPPLGPSAKELQFTFLWTRTQTWEGRDHRVTLREPVGTEREI
jgi:glucoamylase